VSLALKERAPTDHRAPFRGWSTSVSWSILPEVCTHRPALLSLSTTDSLPWLPWFPRGSGSETRSGWTLHSRHHATRDESHATDDNKPNLAMQRLA